MAPMDAILAIFGVDATLAHHVVASNHLLSSHPFEVLVALVTLVKNHSKYNELP